MAPFILRDASNEPPQPATFPGWVAGFEALGFDQIGCVLPAKEVDESYFTLYGTEHEALARRSVSVPEPILVSPGRDAFIEIGEWFFDTPTIRIRTVLADGSLVETRRRWDHPLQPLVQGRHANFSRPIETEMLQSNAPQRGRSVQIAAGNSAAEMWSAHEAHVAQQTAAGSSLGPVLHDSISYFIALQAEAHHHDQSSKLASPRSMKRYILPGAIAPVLVPLLFPVIARLLSNLEASPTIGSFVAGGIGTAGYLFFFTRIFPRIPFLWISPRLRAKFTMPPPTVGGDASLNPVGAR